MTVMEKINLIGLVPVVVVDHAEDGPKIAKALLNGGIGVMEITMRTAAGIEAIKLVKKEVPEMLVGAGTVLTLEKCQESVLAGAEFIVSPGFNPVVVDWCVQNNVPVTPGCVTPTEIEMALARNIKTVKFFPAGVYGGIKACSALYGPYKSAGVKFIPTGGIDLNNLDDYSDKEYIHAIGGGWLCNAKAVEAGDFDAITETAKRSVNQLLGFEVVHVGINAADDDSSMKVAAELDTAFGFAVKPGNSSNFAGSGIEVMKTNYLGEKGHIAVRTNNIERAIYHLNCRGYEIDEATAKYKNNKMNAVYLKNEFGGFAVHLLQK